MHTRNMEIRVHGRKCRCDECEGLRPPRHDLGCLIFLWVIFAGIFLLSWVPVWLAD